MNNPVTAESTLNRFATAVRNFTPKESRKFQKLLPFKEGIAELRRKGASYDTVVDILRNMSVPISRDTVVRFCCEVLDLPPRRRSRRRKSGRRRSTQSSPSQPPTIKTHDHATKGPRVADPNDI